MRRALTGAMMLLAALTACEGGAREAAERVEEAPPRAALGAEARQVFERSLVRDRAPSCAALTDGLREPVAALLEVAERVEAPPSSGMRAASCLVREHAAAVEPQLVRWVSDGETRGFGLLVLNHLDDIEPELARRLARAALHGELADDARRRLARSSIGRELLEVPGDDDDDEGALAPR